MNVESNQEMLTELRRIRRIVFVLLVLVLIFAIPAFYEGFTEGFSRAKPSWEQVKAAMGRQDFQGALSMARTLVAREPNYDYGHTYLGYIYLAMGDVTNAVTQYSQACQIFPSEGNEKDLAAMKKRLASSTGFKLPEMRLSSRTPRTDTTPRE
jgi:cytochrome c-type biogenesis protein CcmH/NrfG